MYRNIRIVLVAACGTAVLGAAPATLAQQLEEIIVTAQKREESVLDVPISMTVVQSETLTDLSVDNFDDMQLYVPSFMVTPTPSNNYIFIRGIGTQGNVLAFESSVALFVDGIYGGRNRQFQDAFLDVGRVEVLRGPQGALFGRNTSAGAVSVTSARPSKEFFAWTQGEYETEFGTWSATGAVSGPVADRLQLRFAGRYAETGGYVRNTLLNRDDGEREDKSARLSATWQPTDAIDVFAKLEYFEGEMIGMPFEFVPAGGDPDLIKTADDRFAPEHDDQEAFNAALQADFALGSHTLTAIAGHSSFEYESAINIQARAPGRLVVENAEEFDQQSLEFRLLSPTGQEVDYIVGIYADRAESIIPSQSTTDLPFTPAPAETITTRHYVENTDSWAVFGQATWNVTESFRLTGGLRYTDITKEGDLTRSFFAVPGFAGRNLSTPLSMERDESFVDPSVNVQWDFTDRWMIYGTYAQGSKSGGFNGPTSTDTALNWMYEEEGSESFEVGLKGRFDRGFLSISVFDTEYTDLQKSVLNVQLATFTTGNAAEAQSRGVEIEGFWQPLDALRINASLAYLDSEFTSFPGAVCPSSGSTDPNCALVGVAVPPSPPFPPTPCPTRPGEFVPNCTTDLAGYVLTNAPEWSGSIAANLELPMTSGLKFVGNLTASYRDDVFYQPSYNPLEMQEGFWKLDLRAGIAAADDKWSASFLVRNLLDEETSGLIFETFALWLTDPARDRVHLPDRPRTYTLQLRYRFN